MKREQGPVSQNSFSPFLIEKFTLIPYHKILSLKIRYFMKLAPGLYASVCLTCVTFLSFSLPLGVGGRLWILIDFSFNFLCWTICRIGEGFKSLQ